MLRIGQNHNPAQDRTYLFHTYSKISKKVSFFIINLFFNKIVDIMGIDILAQ